MGMVTISITSRTSMTSINGVVFISTKTSSLPPGEPTLIDMRRYLSSSPRTSEYRLFRICYEPDFQDRRPLQVGKDPAHRLEAHVLVAANVHFRLRHFH